MNITTNHFISNERAMAPSQSKTTRAKNNAEQAAKRTLSNEPASAPKRIKTARRNESNPTWHLENGTLESFKTALLAIKRKPDQRKKYIEAVQWLVTAPEEKRCLFESCVVDGVLSIKGFRNTFTHLRDDCNLLAKIPYHDRECLELKVIHGIISFTEEEIKAHKSLSDLCSISLLHLAAASCQFSCFETLVKMGLNPYKIYDIGQSIYYLTTAITLTRGSLDQYDSLLNTIFKIHPEPAPAPIQNLKSALKIGIDSNCLEIIYYAQKRAEKRWHEVLDKSLFPKKQPSMAELALFFPNVSPLSQDYLQWRDCRNRNPLHWAIALKNHDLIENLKYTELNRSPDLHDQLPIQLAKELAQYGVFFHLGKMDLPYQHVHEDPWLHTFFSDNPNITSLTITPDMSHSGANLLHFAAVNDNLPLIRACLKTGGDWFQKDTHGHSPLKLSLRHGSNEANQEIIKAMLEANLLWDRENNILHDCFNFKRLEILHYLLDLLPSQDILDKINEYGYSLLHLTTKQNDHLKLTQRLLEKGANPNVQAINRLTPLHQANFKHMEVLIAHGADVNHCKNIERLSPLHFAMRKKDKNGCILLIKKGADLMARSIHGISPFLFFVQTHRDRSGAVPFFSEVLKPLYGQEEIPVLHIMLLTHTQDKIREFAQSLGKNGFKELFNKITVFLPSYNLDSWQDYYYEIDRDHFNIAIEAFDKENPCSIADWHLFLEKSPIDENKRNRIRQWIQSIQDRKEGEDVPKDPKEREDFYNLLEKKLRLILNELLHADQTTQDTSLNSLYDTSRLCGGGWLFDTTEIILSLNPIHSIIKEKVLQLAQNLQIHYLREFAQANKHEFFTYREALRELLPHIPFDRVDLDPYANPKDKWKVEWQFLHSYNPTQLIDSLLSHLENENPSLWMCWLLSFVPENQREEYMDKYYDLEAGKWMREGAIELLVRSGILKPLVLS